MSTAATKSQKRPGAATSTANIVGETLGDFRILRKLGHGGMGDVYLAEQISLKRKVAIKMLRGDVASKPSALTRFKAETTTIAKLNHANVVQAYLVGEHQGHYYLAMEYVEGFSLAEYMGRRGPLEVPLVLSIIRQVANALQRASELGIVHRDIKPANILLTKKGEAKVADFGLARCLSSEERVDLTRAGATVGTPLYMSPEQIEGKELDCRTDIYSLGVTFYQMLAGQAPFEGSNAFVIAAKHVNEEPAALEKVRPEVPRALGDVVRKMMAKKPGARYQSARDLLQDLARVRQSLGAATQVVSIAMDTPAEATPRRPVPHWKQPMWLAIGGSVSALAILAILITVVAVAWPRGAAPVDTPDQRAAAPAPPDKKKPADPAPPDPIDALKVKVDQVLNEKSPQPSGVESCIDLAVLYLERKKTGEAEALFNRMTERRPPSAYYFVGRLGLAVTDGLKNDSKASQAKFKELFQSKAKDNRAQILNDYLTKNPEFAGWVNEADSSNVRNGGQVRSFPKTGRWPMRKSPFRK
ncbi:MAG: serine/threonine protein kinase [Planctomycetes bacterium]|nr:serine/threonine protein kinase [Planctomycetota bacterium]